jgi:HSP20 family protein
MSLVRWQPLWSEMTGLQSEMNRLFGRLSDDSWPTLASAYPAVNVWEDDDNVYAEAELPGLTPDQLEVFVSEGNLLSIQGERKPCETPRDVWHRQERGFGKFNRALQLPVPVDADKVQARFEHGVLLLTMPKSAAAKPRLITVQGA